MPGNSVFSYGIVAAICASSLLVAAVLSLFYGWKLYRLGAAILTALVAVMIGHFYIGPHLPAKWAFVAPAVLGVAGLLLAIPLQRFAAFVATGALGALIAVTFAVVWYEVPFDVMSRKIQIPAAVAFVTVGTLAAIFLRFFIVFVTSAYGGLAALAAAVLVLSIVTSASPPMDTLTIVVVASAWSALTITGMAYQYKSLKAAGGSGKSRK